MLTWLLQKVSHRACQNVLPAKTHRRAVVKQHEEPGGCQDCWVGPGPSTSSRNIPAHVLAVARACHLTYTWSGRCWIASISLLHGRHINIKYEPYRLSGCPVDRLKEPIAP